MKLKKLLVLALALACVAAISITATLAYLNDTEVITNTFTVGKVDIVLDEYPVDDNVEDTGAACVKTNSYKLYPGKSYDKTPHIHVGNESEKCWLFVKVENGISAIEGTNTIANQMEAIGWTEIGTTGVYAYKEISKANDVVNVFTDFEIATTVDNTTLANHAASKIIVTAYAIQAEGFATAEAAWNANGPTFSEDAN